MFIWKVKCFSKLLRQAKAGEVLNIASPTFYLDRSESYDYKLKVLIQMGVGPARILTCIVGVHRRHGR